MNGTVLVLLTLLVKATLAILLAYSGAALLARRSSSLRHLLFAGLFAFLCLLPVAPRVVQGVTWRVPVAQMTRGPLPAVSGTSIATSDLAAPAAHATSSRLNWRVVAASVYVAGGLLALLPLAVAMLRLRALRRNGRIWVARLAQFQTLRNGAGVQRAVDLVLSSELTTPVTFGVFRPTILLPADAASWISDDVDAALLHELEHVRRFDWPLQILSRFVCAAYWFHPLIWPAWHRMNLEAERAADDAVIRVQRQETRYAEQLVELASRLRQSGGASAVAMARRSFLSRRVEAILDARQPRERATALSSTAAVAVSTLLLLTLGAFRLVAETATTLDEAAPLDQALIAAAADGDADATLHALNRGADVNVIAVGDGTPLIVAARRGRIEVVRLLISRGADVNLPVRGDGNALIAAARAGHASIVELLLDSGAAIDAVVDGDENALIQASGAGRLDVVRLLLRRGANPNAAVWADVTSNPPGERRTPLFMARRGRHAAVVDELIRAGARD